ncbi:DNA-directed RNA polymerase subunit omega [Paenibacillus graminis]|uniref:DNA-directed RNA polymerase subunit omega n=1 Tax=Paenibacillus graminis TaxID=189425 RepID=A0A089M834_9BACL|nr:DNA-directed RNA polymerase subunit omega [Paenibacillus graminis]AIQ68520.1 DNA-directed RNA polymerase subunit omega [Paenibacillus graminis]MEC0173090.1 DNA-directed RNA polymerase subunit omega [Paenibacillus graminis]
MLYPSIDEMMTKVDSKYSLVVAAARRARVLREGGRTDIKVPRSHKFVGVALEEIYEDRIVVTRGEE